MEGSILLLTFLIGSAYCVCEPGWVEFRASCYHLRWDTETWMDAKKVCEIFDAHLAEIDDISENAFVQSLIAGMDNTMAWIGGTDLSTETEWIWADSKRKIGYTNWKPNEPNNVNHDENCLEMAGNGLWNDRPCHYIEKYVCEKVL